MTKPAYDQLLRHSPLESARFGLQVYRGHVAPTDIARLWDFIVPHKVDVAIFRAPSENIAAMQAYRGPREQLIHADTLVYYDCAIDRLDIREPSNRGVSYRSATPLDGPALERAVRATFATYQNHYHANPAFSPTSILAGYEEWAVNHLQHGGTTPSWVATDGDVIVGFICCRLDEQDHTAEIVLNGVLPSHAGQGVYGDLVRIAQRFFADRDVKRIRVSTQVGNYRVQRVWSRSGFVLSEAFDTWHVNAMLTHSPDGAVLPVG